MNKPLGPVRFDYRFPLRVGGAFGQAERAGYADHVAQMVRQALLTSPGERVCLPDFGCGLRQLIFAPKTTGERGLNATTEMLVRRTLEKYLSGHIVVRAVNVRDAMEIDEGAVEVTVEYTLVETQTNQMVTLEVR